MSRRRDASARRVSNSHFWMVRMTVFDDGALEGRGALKNNYFSEDFSTACSGFAPAVTKKTHGKPPSSGTYERVSVDGTEVLQRWKNGFAAGDWTGPSPLGNAWLFETLDDGCRRVTAAAEDPPGDNPDADIRSEIYQIFSCPEDDERASGGAAS